MVPQPEFSRLCRLVDESLRPYTELLSLSLTKQSERKLLIALSQVSCQIKLWTDDSDSDTERIAKPYVEGEYSVSLTSHSEDHHCLAKIVGELVLLLAVESRYVQQIAGNVLVVISEFVAASGSYWDEYMHLLCLFLELSICNCLPSSEPPTRSKDLNCDSPTSVEVLKLALKTTTWSNVAGIICVLRNILKHLKKECDDQLLKVYFASIRTCLSNIPWDLLNEIHLGGKSLGSSARDASLYTSIEQLNSRFLLSGNLVQFFCSLVAQGDSSETTVSYLNEQRVTCEISNILPKVLAWCLGKQECNNTHTSQYLRHKILDDILFKVLLQLFCTPFSERPVCKGENTFQEVKHDLLFLISNLLNPIRLFHLFLAELHYDHQVLLDYLISKDTGASSAEYLLRCLRAVCDSWDFFAEFSLGEEVINQAHHKKRKILVDGPDFRKSLFSAQHEGDLAPLSLQKGSKREHKCGSTQHGIKRLPFEDAMECLLSLKNSLVNLHQKKLFPYNPDVLLRRLRRFEELCLKQKNIVESEVIV